MGTNPEAVDPTAIDPNFRPDRTDHFPLTLQREIKSKMELEAGCIGKIIRNEVMEENLDAVPYMTTLVAVSTSSPQSPRLPVQLLQFSERPFHLLRLL